MPKVKTNGITLYYEVSGEDDAPAMVWHGHHHKTWMWQQNYFSEWYRVITYDRRGTGFSDTSGSKEMVFKRANSAILIHQSGATGYAEI